MPASKFRKIPTRLHIFCRALLADSCCSDIILCINLCVTLQNAIITISRTIRAYCSAISRVLRNAIHGCNGDQWTKRLMETTAKMVDKDGKEKAGTTLVGRHRVSLRYLSNITLREAPHCACVSHFCRTRKRSEGYVYMLVSFPARTYADKASRSTLCMLNHHSHCYHLHIHQCLQENSFSLADMYKAVVNTYVFY